MSTKNERREPHMTSSDTTSPILITGATGRHGGTGAHLARRLREAGRSVRALVRRLDERTAPLQALGAEIVVGDLALLHPERFEGGMVQYPPGAELLSHAEVARVLSEELSRPIRFVPITREAWRDELLALAEAHPGGAVNPIMADHISTLGAAAAAAGKLPSKTADAAALQRLTDRAPLSFRSFVQKERERFLQAAPGTVNFKEPT